MAEINSAEFDKFLISVHKLLISVHKLLISVHKLLILVSADNTEIKSLSNLVELISAKFLSLVSEFMRTAVIRKNQQI